MSRLIQDARVLYRLALAPVGGADHQSRLESFYKGQADDYDDFRERMLHGRRELFDAIDVPEGGVWVDLGGGTGATMQFLGNRLRRLSSAWIVDLAPSLLEVAHRRIDRMRWRNVWAIQADATTFTPPRGQADVVTFSYSLTMIPEWFDAIENALRILRPGGILGVVDFHVARKRPADSSPKQGWLSRNLWPVWFALDDVHLNPDHVPYLRRRFEVESFRVRRGKIPYLPFVRVPHYVFIGRKAHV